MYKLFLITLTAGIIFPLISVTRVNATKDKGKWGLGDKIVGGHDVSIAEYPWQLFLWMQLDVGIATCGATLISDQWVLTAAHCFNYAEGGLVFAGSNDWMEMMLGNEGVPSYIDEYVLHPLYNPDENLFLHDLALVRLLKPLNFTESIQPISITTSETVEEFDTHVGTATGWGTTAGGSDILSTYLKAVDLNIVQLHHCVKVYGEQINHPSILCTEGMHHSDGGICVGDSGGPLSKQDKHHNVHLVGIAAFRSELCSSIAPTGFINVSYYEDWIHEVSGISTD